MVKATSITNVKSIASRVALKNDGTVWAIERTSEAEQPNYKEHISETLGERIPHLENIVKVDEVGTLVLAIDRDGKVWIIETVKYDLTMPLKAEPVLVEGIDHVKDVLVSTDYNEITFLKEDGTVWNIDEYSPWGSSTPLYDTIRYSKPVQLENLKDIVQLKNNHFAIKKDGTVWNWGRTTDFSKSRDFVNVALTPAAPYQLGQGLFCGEMGSSWY
ncbi:MULTISPECIES: hypothetical protein [Paenibacillus]|nr:hypothetical protein [Paenibacillus anseongense]MEC0267846.1 hypothetical protein [Paenibacillus anseongense]